MRRISERIPVSISSPYRRVKNGCRRVSHLCRRSWGGFLRIVTQSGWADLRTSTIVTLGLVGPLWVVLTGTHELGLNAVVGAICGGGWMGLGISPVIAAVLRLTIVVFFTKFLVRSMVTLARAGSQTPDIKNPAFSLAGSLLPAVATGVLRVGDSSIAVCLFP